MKSFIISLLALMTFSAFANYRCNYKAIDFRSEKQPELEFSSIEPIILQVSNRTYISENKLGRNNYQVTLHLDSNSNLNSAHYSLSHNSDVVIKGSTVFDRNQSYLSFEVEDDRYFLMVSCQKIDID